jgi:hypothetical protein
MLNILLPSIFGRLKAAQKGVGLGLFLVARGVLSR